MGRRMRGQLPTLPQAREGTDRDPNSTNQEDCFKVGDHVIVQDTHTKLWTETGIITSIRRSDSSGSFYILLDSGGEIIRNCKFLRKANK
jgi:hypothetical protein